MATRNKNAMRLEIAVTFTHHRDLCAVLDEIRRQAHGVWRDGYKNLIGEKVMFWEHQTGEVKATLGRGDVHEPQGLPTYGSEFGVFAWEALGWEIKEINGVKCATKRSKL